jgi:hydroxypyruvate isomerase
MRSGLPTTPEGQAMANATYTVNCSILLTDLPLLDRPRAARDAGFDAVEFWWPFASASPSDAEVAAFVHAIEDAGVQLTGLNFAAGDMPAGDRGILSNPSLTQAFRDSVAIAIGIAEILGTRSFNALYGNRDPNFASSAHDHVALDNLAHAAVAADRIGATVLLEPVSGAPLYPLKTAADVIQVIDRVHTQSGATNLRLLADLYHLAVNGDDTSAAIRDYGSRIGHVQLADAPGRGEPGSGQLPLGNQLQELSDRGYNGYLGLEYKATGPDPFDWIPRVERGARGVNIETLRLQQETRIA